ncbi:4-coumarate-- ligase 3 [Lecanosticta acicola]|uniref:4-coumarate-- ligase 3 n=1 Tax=Lecanosticta acicola TaxID=111012 RepID=A0AAI8Z3D4_9PEZI|nr:4-coumarate-- ligase 3 [Lecanosticta acicola]
MIYSSPLPDLDIPKCNILSYLYPKNQPISEDPAWYDSSDFSINVNPKQMLQWSKRVMIGLDRLGLQKGDVCMVHSPNHVLFPAAYLGIVGGARCFSAVNPIYTVDEIVHQMTLTNAKCLLTHPSLVERGLEAAKKAGTITPDRIFQFTDDAQPCKEKHGVKDWRYLLGSEEEAETYQWRELSPEESVNTVATINFSSGTTGMPKGVKISHHSLIANVAQTAKIRWPKKDFAKGDIVTDERWIGFLPLYHAYGQMYANLMAAKFSIPIYIMRQFVYEDFLRCVQDAKVTDLQVAPPVLVMLSKRPETEKYDLSSIRSILCGGAPLGKELQNEIARRFNCRVTQGYGMTEVVCASALQSEQRDDGTVGRLVPNTQLRLVDDDGKDVGPNTPGEMLIKAPNVMLGYWKNEEATKDALTSDGWLKTGDVAVINQEGYVWIVDRKKELIKVNALQVAPAELEDRLLENKSIADAAAAGVKVDHEEFPRAYVVLTEEAKEAGVTEKQIQDWFKTRVAKHKALVGGVKFVDEIPKLASGKIQRKVLREWTKRDADEVSKSLNRAKL